MKLMAQRPGAVPRWSPLFFLLIPLVTASAQHGSAPTGYYPPGYGGSTFSGKLVEVDPQTQTVVLRYEKGKKTEQFKGSLDAGCAIPRSDHAKTLATVSDFPKDAEMMVFYNEKTEKVNGEKRTQDTIFAVSFISLSGKEIGPDHRMVYYCNNNGYKTYQAH